MKISKKKLELELARKCWNQRRLRETSCVSGQLLRNINAGKEILPASAGKIAAALGVDVLELLESED